MRINSAGAAGIGGTPIAGQTVFLNKTITGNVNSTQIRAQGSVQSDVTTGVNSIDNVLVTAGAAFTLTNYTHFNAQQVTIGAGSVVTDQYGFRAGGVLTGGTNNYGFHGNIAAPTSGITTTGTISTISSSGTAVTVSHNAITYTNGQTVTISATANATALVSGATATILTVGTTDYT
jgi:hypothetical protein